MKRIAIAIVLALAILTVSANAQGRVLARVEIPFNFSANDQDLTAGSYRLYQVNSHVIRLLHVATNRGVTFITPQSIAESPTTRFVFRNYGTRLFLGAVISHSYQVSIRPSRKENDLRKISIAMNTITVGVGR